MSIKLSVYQPKDATELDPSEPVEVCLALQKTTASILLHIVDPDTGQHITGGNLLNVYPDGTYRLVGGVKFGDVLGFSERSKS